MFRVLLGKDECDAQIGPRDIDIRVVPHETALVFWMVKIRAFIGEYCGIAHDEKTMGEPLRNVEHIILIA